jgi:hypothetical protein
VESGKAQKLAETLAEQVRYDALPKSEMFRRNPGWDRRINKEKKAERISNKERKTASNLTKAR